MLSIKNLHASIDGKEILRGIDLEIKAGQVHAIMGPNASGKSTLAQLLAGRGLYDVTAGSVQYLGRDLLSMTPEQRACEGVFLAFQYPVEIPGISNALFLKTALNSIRKYHLQPELDAMDFLSLVRERMQRVGMDDAMLLRAVNEGFSGGEKKRNEILQLSVLQPRLAILDETDSGLDIDALKLIADGINDMRDPARAIIMVTHYQRLLDYVVPDMVHVLSQGRIVKSGGADLAKNLEQHGYSWVNTDDIASQLTQVRKVSKVAVSNLVP